jgi:hypothetical protein
MGMVTKGGIDKRENKNNKKHGLATIKAQQKWMEYNVESRSDANEYDFYLNDATFKIY